MNDSAQRFIGAKSTTKLHHTQAKTSSCHESRHHHNHTNIMDVSNSSSLNKEHLFGWTFVCRMRVWLALEKISNFFNDPPTDTPTSRHYTPTSHHHTPISHQRQNHTIHPPPSHYTSHHKSHITHHTTYITHHTSHITHPIKHITHHITSHHTSYHTLSLYIGQLAATLEPAVKTLVDIFVAMSYDLSEDQFAAFDDDDPFVTQFTATFDEVMGLFKERLTQNNYEELLQCVMKTVIDRLEKATFKKSYNQLGGLQFDKDMRKLVSYFSARTQRPVRAEFSRLILIGTLLGLECADDVIDYRESSGDTWRLTHNEIRHILSRRGFKAEDIARLPL